MYLYIINQNKNIMDTHINNSSKEPNFEILKDSFEIPNLQMMFTKEQVTQILLKFGLENKLSLRTNLEYVNSKKYLK